MNPPSVLAFERKLDPSDALFAAGKWGEWEKGWSSVPVREKAVRGTISNRLPAREQDPAKLNASVKAPNPQTIDVASLKADCDTLRVCFSLRILGGVGYPSACNEPDYQQNLLGIVAKYRKETGFTELAHRYAVNIANGRFLWRNRLASEAVLVNVCHMENGVKKANWQFDAFSFPMDVTFSVSKSNESSLDALAKVIADCLVCPIGGYSLLEVTAFARMGHGQEVFPSQELILKDKQPKPDKRKILYSVDGIAGMHSQKIGNALRTIDTWYPYAMMPIAVEPYGAVTSLGKVFRQPKSKSDFYSLLDEWILKDKVPDEGNQHFVMATIIRGGVFGSSDKG